MSVSIRVCLQASEGVGECVSGGLFLSVCVCIPRASVYEPLGVGVCSCVYPACSEIVTDLCKQFTVNSLFPTVIMAR